MRKRPYNPAHPSSTGQALVELITGLVGLLVLTAVLLQLGRIGLAHSEAMANARGQAGAYAMNDTYILALPEPLLIYDWDEGPDGRRHSQDDQAIQTSADALVDDILIHAHQSELAIAQPGNAVSSIINSETWLDELHLVHGQDSSGSIPLLPVVRSLIYDTDSIQVDTDVWLTWTRGL